MDLGDKSDAEASQPPSVGWCLCPLLWLFNNFRRRRGKISSNLTILVEKRAKMTSDFQSQSSGNFCLRNRE